MRCASLRKGLKAVCSPLPSGATCASNDDAVYSVATVAVATAARDNALRARRFILRNPAAGPCRLLLDRNAPQYTDRPQGHQQIDDLRDRLALSSHR
jgi:hypothetical protein